MHPLRIRHGSSIWSRAAALALVPVAAGLVAGCRSTPQPPIEPGAFQGPTIRLSTDARQHRVVLEAPSGGWQFRLDQVRKRFGGFDAFVTARRPDPTFNHTQAIVEQFAGTGVAPSSGVDVYARVIDFNAQAERQPYRLVLSAAPAALPEPSRPSPAP